MQNPDVAEKSSLKLLVGARICSEILIQVLAMEKEEAMLKAEKKENEKRFCYKEGNRKISLKKNREINWSRELMKGTTID